VALIGAATPGTTVVAPETREVRVLSYNLHQGFNNAGVLDADLFVRVLGEVDADLVSLQESDTARFTSGNMDIVSVLAHRLGYEAYYGQPTRAQSFGVAVLSRYPIQETSLLPLTSSADNRYLVAARVDVDGTDVWFLAIHMALARENRLAQFEEIMAHAERLGGTRILAGDLNSCPNGHCPEYAGDADTVYEQATAQYQDTWTAAGHGRDDPGGHTYHAAHPDRRIDYILVSDGIAVRDARVVRSAAALAASDHLPVVAELTLEG
jgi:endonuclease/exonuclease/phosphatase family metal-dependent hydrolase